MKIIMNELKKNLEEYLDSGMWQFEAPYIGKDEVEMILNVFNALDLLLEWVTDCDWGYDNIPDLYEKYNKEISGMGYIEGLKYIVLKESEKERL